mgnify:CR=1 FL=1
MAELVEHLAEENAEPTEVKGFGLVHAATKPALEVTQFDQRRIPW